MKQGTQFTKKI